ncbi:3'(2'),5'-bisphosphate nucleotidase CysQ [Oryzibacter oryziterrae]|uniref:3'(2'),5'-bisphosphate nucleotidase CysQ n=1 Tax=Oryzibacter oryziterrae TaxID=2766474 RepID=UPI001F021D7D|nr:3'(2'),5'-bisphosphate nucleotidase CysQ [Oryzibacter oryziterrae]
MTLASPALLDGLILAAIEAGREILDVYAQPIAVSRKADASPVTEADERAEAVILAALARLAPDVPVVAEESVAAGRIPATGERFFLVDPLDGTKEFIAGNGEFTVNIGLIEHGVPVMGVVYAPAQGRLFAGGPDGACTAEVVDGRAGPRRSIVVRALPPSGVTVVGSRSHGSDSMASFLQAFAVERFISAGSSLKFCLIAAGEADFYPRFGRTMEWDTAAGDAVLRAAGGLMTRTDGTAFLYGKRNQAEDCDFANPHFLAAGHPSLIRT